MTDPTGSTPTTSTAGFRSFRYAPAPEMVPPVPAPPTRWVMRPPLCSQSSGPVVA